MTTLLGKREAVALFSLVCDLYTACHRLFILSLGITGRLYYVIWLFIMETHIQIY